MGFGTPDSAFLLWLVSPLALSSPAYALHMPRADSCRAAAYRAQRIPAGARSGWVRILRGFHVKD